MFHRFDARLRRLEQQAVRSDVAHGDGLSSLLVISRSKEEDTVPLASLPDADLDAKITALAGTRGFSPLLREALEEERTRRGQYGEGDLSMNHTLAHQLTRLEQQVRACNAPM